MIAHLFRLVWNRRRSQGLLLAELLVSFVVVAGVAASMVHLGRLAQRPLGFEPQNVWHVYVSLGRFFGSMSDEERAAVRSQMKQVLREAQQDPAVEAAALALNTPYSNGRSQRGVWWEGELVRILYAGGTADLDRVLGLQMAAGRWFEQKEVETSQIPVVMTRDLLRLYFGDEDPVGKVVPSQNEDGSPDPPSPDDPAYRVIGVLDDYRWQGEYGAPHYSMFVLEDLDRPSRYTPTDMLIRMRPGVGGEAEKHLMDRLQAAAPGWRFQVTPLESMRRSKHRQQLAGPIIGLIVASFLVLTVALGLVGVLWQNVTRRTQEIGVRRAMGATANGVRAQVLGEMLALTTVAVVLGAALVVQAPLLHFFPSLGWVDYLLAMAFTATFLVVLVVVCGMYPSWLATRVSPAKALSYE